LQIDGLQIDGLQIDGLQIDGLLILDWRLVSRNLHRLLRIGVSNRQLTIDN